MLSRKTHHYADPPVPQDDPVDLDSERKAAEHELGQQILSWWREARSYQAENRELMDRDAKFYAGDQWTQDEIRELEARGQYAAVYNLVKTNIDWVSGTERRATIDFHVLPRAQDDVENAAIKTKLLKHIADYTHFNWHRSNAFLESLVAGVSFLEVGVRGDDTEYPIYLRHQTWRDCWWDALSREPDLSDARFFIRSKTLPLSIAKAMFPDQLEALEASSDVVDRFSLMDDQSTTYYADAQGKPLPFDYGDPTRYESTRAIRLLECWHRKTEPVKRIGGRYRGLFDETNPRQQQALMNGQCSLYDAIVQRVYCSIVTVQGDVLYTSPSPYQYDAFPFVPVWCHRRDDNGLPYGLVRNLISPQMSLNKRKAKSLFLLSVNRVIADRGAVDDPHEFELEAARPDAIIWKHPGKEIVFDTAPALAESHLAFAREDAQFIRDASGVTSENLGQSQSELSGRAINLRQQQGSVATAHTLDALRYATQRAGEQLLALVEKLYTTPLVVRLTGESTENPEFMPLNQAQPDGRILNDIAAATADFKVAEVDYRESERQATFELLLQTVSRMDPAIANNVMDLVIDAADFPQAKALAARLRQLNGQSDPNDPQAQQHAQQQAQAQAAQAEQDRQLALDAQVAEVRKTQVAAEKMLAEISLIMAKAVDVARPDVQFQPSSVTRGDPRV